jgi:hypothetical protein
MKQILQNLKTGKTELVEVPCPVGKAGHLLIQTSVSLISVGTERMLVEFSKANLMRDVGTLSLYKPSSYSVESQGGNCET